MRGVGERVRMQPPPRFSGDMPVCHHTGVSATAHIGRAVLFRSSPKAHHRTGQVARRSAVPYPGCLDGGRANPGIGRSAPRRGRCLLHQARQHQSSRRRRVDRSSPPGPHLDDAALSCRGPCRAGKNAPPRALPTNVASISPRHLSGFVTSQLLRGAGLCRSRPARKGRSFEGVSPFTGCFPPHPTSCPKLRHQTQQHGDGLILPDPRSLGLRHR